MHLVMFDIDGTLTQTNAADTSCYVRAVCETLQIDTIDSDWHNYRHVTDSGIASEVIERIHDRPAQVRELDQICDRFVDVLNQTFDVDASLCKEVPGANEVLHMLRSHGDVTIALATGGWQRSAKLKLERAGIDVSDLVIASASDAIPRDEIMRIAHDRAAERCSIARFESFTYVGDGLWDLEASQRLQIPFIGIGAGERAARLHAAGARWILPNFAPPAHFFAALSEAAGIRAG